MSKKISLCAMLIALAMIFSYVEVLIPFNFGIPGIKLGIANLVIVVGLCFLKPRSILSFCFKNPSCGNLIWKWNVFDLQYCRRNV